MTPSPPTLLDSDHVYIVCRHIVSDCPSKSAKNKSTRHIQDRFRQIAVQLCQTTREFGHIDSDQLIRILYPIVQSRDSIECQLTEVLVVNMVRQPCAILQAQLRLMPRQHRVGKCRRHRNQHPPHNPLQELFPIALDQRLDYSAVHGRYLERDERAHHQKEAMADEQPRLFATPAGDDDTKQAYERAEELSVELNLLLFLGVLVVTLAQRGGRFAFGALALRGSLLLCNGIADAIDEGNGED